MLGSFALLTKPARIGEWASWNVAGRRKRFAGRICRWRGREQTTNLLCWLTAWQRKRVYPF